MPISDEEFVSIIVAATGHNDFHSTSTNHSREVFSRSRHFPSWAGGLRELLNGLAELEFRQQVSPLQTICRAGCEYGLRALKKRVSSELFSLMRSKAKRHI